MTLIEFLKELPQFEPLTQSLRLSAEMLTVMLVQLYHTLTPGLPDG